jgi:hypothetical protein
VLSCPAIVQGDVRRWSSPGATSTQRSTSTGSSPCCARRIPRCAAPHRAALRPGGKLLLEILEYERFDKRDSNWWYTDRGGLWGDFPYLHLGERAWDPEQGAAVERFHILNLETGELQVYGLADQAYTVAQVTEMLHRTGFATVEVHPAWDGLALKDAEEWAVYVGIAE